MFCAECGNELEEDARFCTKCGASTDEARTSKPESESGTLKAAIEATKHRSRRRVPLVLLIAFALALVTGVAYAAFWVYTEVVLRRWKPFSKHPQRMRTALRLLTTPKSRTPDRKATRSTSCSWRRSSPWKTPPASPRSSKARALRYATRTP